MHNGETDYVMYVTQCAGVDSLSDDSASKQLLAKKRPKNNLNAGHENSKQAARLND